MLDLFVGIVSFIGVLAFSAIVLAILLDTIRQTRTAFRKPAAATLSQRHGQSFDQVNRILAFFVLFLGLLLGTLLLAQRDPFLINARTADSVPATVTVAVADTDGEMGGEAQ